MLETFSMPRLNLRGTRYFGLNLVLTVSLLAAPYSVQAERNSSKQHLQAMAAANAKELGNVAASGRWTRVEFSKTYIDPVIVVDSSATKAENAYIVGIRNVDSMGFEINVKSCNSTSDVPSQENVNFSVLDNSQVSSHEGNSHIRQVYAWGKCSA